MDRLGRIAVFLKVVEQQSFSGAARSLKISQPTVSKAIADLEAGLDVRLLNRTTHKLGVTDLGAAYYQRTKHLVAELEAVELDLLEANAAIVGRLHVNASAMLAENLIVPALISFKALHPAVNIELTLDDRRIDPVAYSIDVAVRIGELADSSLQARKAGRVASGIFASAEYLLSKDMQPAAITSLAGHQLISYSAQGTRFLDGADSAEVAMKVGNALLAKQVMLAGVGLAALPHFLVQQEVASGKVFEVLESTQISPVEINLPHPFGHDAPRTVSAFISHAITKWRQDRLIVQ